MAAPVSAGRRPKTAPKPAAPAHPQPLQDAHMLIVEDAPDNRRLISFHIKKAGGTFDLAENGEIAVNKVRQARSDACLTTPC